MLRLVEQLFDLILFIEMWDELALQVILDEVNQEMHDGLWYCILDVFTNDEKVGPDETLCGGRQS